MGYYQTELEKKACDAILGSMHDGAAWNGDARRQKLGDDYDAVQAIINKLMRDPQALTSALAAYVLDGHAGNGEDRKKLLGIYAKRVQAEINFICMAAEVIASGSGDYGNGDYGNGEERKAKLGWHYDLVQKMVNKLLADKPLSQTELDKLVAGVWAGDYGNGEERKEKLGARYEQVQKAINDGLVIVKRSSVPKLTGKMVAVNLPTKGKRRVYCCGE